MQSRANSGNSRKKIVNDIYSVVKYTRFEGWQWTDTGEKEIKKELRKTLLKDKLHKDQELFDKTYEYIREHYQFYHIPKFLSL